MYNPSKTQRKSIAQADIAGKSIPGLGASTHGHSLKLGHYNSYAYLNGNGLQYAGDCKVQRGEVRDSPNARNGYASGCQASANNSNMVNTDKIRDVGNKSNNINISNNSYNKYLQTVAVTNLYTNSVMQNSGRQSSPYKINFRYNSPSSNIQTRSYNCATSYTPNNLSSNLSSSNNITKKIVDYKNQNNCQRQSLRSIQVPNTENNMKKCDMSGSIKINKPSITFSHASPTKLIPKNNFNFTYTIANNNNQTQSRPVSQFLLNTVSSLNAENQEQMYRRIQLIKKPNSVRSVPECDPIYNSCQYSVYSEVQYEEIANLNIVKPVDVTKELTTNNIQYSNDLNNSNSDATGNSISSDKVSGGVIGIQGMRVQNKELIRQQEKYQQIQLRIMSPKKNKRVQRCISIQLLHLQIEASSSAEQSPLLDGATQRQQSTMPTISAESPGDIGGRGNINNMNNGKKSIEIMLRSPQLLKNRLREQKNILVKQSPMCQTQPISAGISKNKPNTPTKNTSVIATNHLTVNYVGNNDSTRVTNDFNIRASCQTSNAHTHQSKNDTNSEQTNTDFLQSKYIRKISSNLDTKDFCQNIVLANPKLENKSTMETNTIQSYMSSNDQNMQNTDTYIQRLKREKLHAKSYNPEVTSMYGENNQNLEQPCQIFRIRRVIQLFPDCESEGGRSVYDSICDGQQMKNGEVVRFQKLDKMGRIIQSDLFQSSCQ